MDSRSMRMDSEFDKYLVDMKPYLLNLPHKTERQRCALWIKKLCEPVGSSTARKNRNMYAKLLLHMLKRGVVEGPFSTWPDTGILKSLPSYMSIFFDEPVTSGLRYRKGNEVDKSQEDEFKMTTTPDWAKEELPFSASEAFTGMDENLSFLENYRSSPLQAKQNQDDAEYQGDHGLGKIPDFRASKGASTFRDQQSLINIHEKELEMKTKLLEAGFHEEKLNLQHKHDIAVQKILDRKNNEIDELKRHYKSKEKDNEETKRKLEKKLQAITKEAQASSEAKDKQLEEATTLADDVRESLRAEYDTKIHDLMGTMEREKYELQKSHTKNIQELLDDTNHRLANMEDEYNSQTQATKVIVSELEQHVSQLSHEAEAMSNAKQLLQAENQQLEIEQSKLVAEAKQANRKCEDLHNEVTTLRNELSSRIRSIQTKHDASVEYLKQEHKVNTTRTQETIREMEDQVQSLRHALQDSEQQRSREMREKESLHQQDLMSAQHLHEKKLHSLRAEWDQERAQHNRAIKALEDTIKDKDDEIVKLTVTQKQCTSQAEQAIESYKKQASDAQQKVYADMRSQLEKMEADLEQSKIARDHLQAEFKKQIEEIKERHNDEMNENRMVLENDKSSITRRFTVDRDRLVKEYEGQLLMAEARLREALEQQEKIAEERRSQHQEVVSGLELQIRELREELVSANALRRQQLVELGLLREEERQKASRDHDIAVAKLEAEIDRQRSELHQRHAGELERQTLKMKSKIEHLEVEHHQQMERSHERLMDAQNKEAAAREMLVQSKNEAEEQILNTVARLEDEGNHLKMQHHHLLMNAQSELEKLKDEHRIKTRHFQQVEFELKNELSRVKLECEERTKDMLPKSLKLDLEETIACLRSQIKSLQQRIEVLQDEVEDDLSKSFPASESYRL